MVMKYMALAALLGNGIPEQLGSGFDGGLKQPLEQYSAGSQYMEALSAAGTVERLFDISVDLPDTARISYESKVTSSGLVTLASVDLLGDGVTKDDLVIARSNDLGVCLTSLNSYTNVLCGGNDVSENSYEPHSTIARDFYSVVGEQDLMDRLRDERGKILMDHMAKDAMSYRVPTTGPLLTDVLRE